MILIFFIPGYAFTWVIYTRKDDLSFIVRIALSCVLSIAIVMLSGLVLDFILGVETTGLNIAVMLVVLTLFFILLYAIRVILNIHGHIIPEWITAGYLALQRRFSRFINSWRDRFTGMATTAVVWHETVLSGRFHADHFYLIDIGKEIDIQRIDENKLKISENCLVPPPHPRTQYFELVIRVFMEDGTSLVDDVEVYPVHVTRKPDRTFMGIRIHRSSLKITGRIYEKTDTTEIQWIYSHDFHLYSILYSQDNLAQMVDRILVKLDEIATSIQKGSPIPSHVELTQNLKEEFKIIPETPRRIPELPKAPVTYQRPRIIEIPVESDRRSFQAEIVRDLNVKDITRKAFGSSDDRMITRIKIPDKTDIDKIKASLKEMEDDDWMYE